MIVMILAVYVWELLQILLPTLIRNPAEITAGHFRAIAICIATEIARDLRLIIVREIV